MHRCIQVQHSAHRTKHPPKMSNLPFGSSPSVRFGQVHWNSPYCHPDSISDLRMESEPSCVTNGVPRTHASKLTQKPAIQSTSFDFPTSLTSSERPPKTYIGNHGGSINSQPVISAASRNVRRARIPYRASKIAQEPAINSAPFGKPKP